MTQILSISAFIVFLVVFYAAYKAKPADDQSGNGINPPTTSWHVPKKSLCIGTYNVQTGKDANGKRDIKRSAEVIKDCDIVGIQEVYAKPWFGQQSQTQQLAEENDMGWLFAATRRRWFREHRGNAVLSRIDLKDWSVKMLPDNTGKQYRNFIKTSVNLNGVEITLLITHLHTKKGRMDQIKAVIDEFQRHEHAVLLGDLNSRPDNELLSSLLKEPNISDALRNAFPEHDHSERIDWIITKNLQASAATYEKIGVSDHPFYSINITLD